MIQTGIYESLITRLLHERLSELESSYHIERKPVDSAEAAEYLSRFLTHVLRTALESLPNNDERVFKQIDLSNALVKWLADYLNNAELSENLLHSQGQILFALFTTHNPIAADLKAHVAKITPLTGLAQSELFTGCNVGLSLESEIKREILSADEVCWIVSFIKWKPNLLLFSKTTIRIEFEPMSMTVVIFAILHLRFLFFFLQLIVFKS